MIWIIVGFIMVLVCPISMTVGGKYKDEESELWIEVVVFLVLKKRWQVLNRQTNRSFIPSQKKYQPDYRKVYRLSRQLCKHIALDTFLWHTRFGMKDVTHTGAGVGGVWAVKQGALGACGQIFDLHTQGDFMVTPDFTHPGVSTRGKVRLTCRMYYLLFYVPRLAWCFVK